MDDDKHQLELVEARREIETKGAAEAGQISFAPKFLAATCLPYRQPRVSDLNREGSWVRENGHWRLVVDPRDLGDDQPVLSNDPHLDMLKNKAERHPSGLYPRLVLAWIATQVVKDGRTTSDQDRILEAGESYREFLRRVGLNPSWGDKGTAKAMTEQMTKLWNVTFNITRNEAGEKNRYFFSIAEAYRINQKEHVDDDQLADLLRGMPESNQFVLLTEQCVKEIQRHRVVLDWRAVQALKRHTMALDLYMYLSYRLHESNFPGGPGSSGRFSAVRWEDLMVQFGTVTKQRKKFREQFKAALKQVHEIWPEADIRPHTSFVELRPSKPLVPHA